MSHPPTYSRGLHELEDGLHAFLQPDGGSYLRFVEREFRQRFAAGMDAVAAADDIDLGQYASWGDAERIAVNVEMVYRELDPGRPTAPVPERFVRMPVEGTPSASHRAPQP